MASQGVLERLETNLRLSVKIVTAEGGERRLVGLVWGVLGNVQ